MGVTLFTAASNVQQREGSLGVCSTGTWAPTQHQGHPCLLQDKAHRVAGLASWWAEPPGCWPVLMELPPTPLCRRVGGTHCTPAPLCGRVGGTTASLLDELAAGCFPRPWALEQNGRLLHTQFCSAQFLLSPGVRFRADHADTAYDPTDNLKLNSHKTACQHKSNQSSHPSGSLNLS